MPSNVANSLAKQSLAVYEEMETGQNFRLVVRWALFQRPDKD